MIDWIIRGVLTFVLLSIWLSILDRIFGFEATVSKRSYDKLTSSHQTLESTHQHVVERNTHMKNYIQELRKELDNLKSRNLTLPKGYTRPMVIQNERKISVLRSKNKKLKGHLDHAKRIIEFQKELLQKEKEEKKENEKKKVKEEKKDKEEKKTKKFFHNTYNALLEGLMYSDYHNDIQMYTDILSSSD